MNDDLIHFTDWLPTLLALTGVARPDGPELDGRDVGAQLMGRPDQDPPRRFWQWNFYKPYVGTNAAMRDGQWKLVRPMIAGTRFFNKALYASEADEEKVRAFIEADLRHKKDPSSVMAPLPVPTLKMLPPEAPELYDLASDPGETTNLATTQPERVSRMLRELETWFESVEADRLTAMGVSL